MQIYFEHKNAEPTGVAGNDKEEKVGEEVFLGFRN